MATWTLSIPATLRHEPMRIAGKKVDDRDGIEVRYPIHDEVVGTVPRRRRRSWSPQAFPIARGYKPKLTRYERQQILLQDRRDLLSARKEDLPT